MLIKRYGTLAFVFFAVKGILWLAIPAAAAWLAI
jgi:hypothetical protein